MSQNDLVLSHSALIHGSAAGGDIALSENNNLIEQYVEDAMIVKVKFQYISTIFHHLFYGFSSLQCLQYRALICRPLEYSEYSQTKLIIARVIGVGITSLIFSMDKGIFFALKITKSQMYAYHRLIIFRIVKLIVMRVAYTALLIDTMLKVRKSIAQSIQVRNDDVMCKLLIVVCYIPLVCNALYFFVDVITIIEIVLRELMQLACKSFTLLLTLNLVPGLTLFTYTICSIILCLAYVALFPNLRKCNLVSCRNHES